MLSIEALMPPEEYFIQLRTDKTLAAFFTICNSDKMMAIAKIDELELVYKKRLKEFKSKIPNYSEVHFIKIEIRRLDLILNKIDISENEEWIILLNDYKELIENKRDYFNLPKFSQLFIEEKYFNVFIKILIDLKVINKDIELLITETRTTALQGAIYALHYNRFRLLEDKDIKENSLVEKVAYFIKIKKIAPIKKDRKGKPTRDSVNKAYEFALKEIKDYLQKNG